ncbi:hypothetical protein DFJ73DRAFT_884959 [Zopfochytrium polystomum]|nr:hypothetical protein DFJ73DRAFT_884959 [Zopfochytrium polystomum]
MSSSSLSLPASFGYVIAVAIVGVLQPVVLGAQVNSARRKAKIPYPFLYASETQCEKSKEAYLFNCYQRAHQNTLENLPTFITLLACGGLQHPKIAAACGVVFIVGRALYASGYQTGDPKKRARGTIQYLGLLGLLGLSIKAAISFL